VIDFLSRSWINDGGKSSGTFHDSRREQKRSVKKVQEAKTLPRAHRPRRFGDVFDILSVSGEDRCTREGKQGGPDPTNHGAMGSGVGHKEGVGFRTNRVYTKEGVRDLRRRKGVLPLGGPTAFQKGDNGKRRVVYPRRASLKKKPDAGGEELKKRVAGSQRAFVATRASTHREPNRGDERKIGWSCRGKTKRDA